MSPTVSYRSAVRPLAASEGSGYLVEFPDLPGCMSDGETIEEAIVNAADAMRCWIKAMEEADRMVAPSVSSIPAG